MRIDSIEEEGQRANGRETRTCGHLGSMPERYNQGKQRSLTDSKEEGVSESDKLRRKVAAE